MSNSIILESIILLITFFLIFYKLDIYPQPWFDEGLNFQPVRNLFLYGQYAMLSSGEIRVMDPAIQTGPTVILPAVLSFWLWGDGVLQARLVSGLFSMLCVAVYFRVAYRLYNPPTAWISVLLLLTFSIYDPFLSFLFIGRQFLGETTALFFFLSGLLLWFRSWELVEWKYLAGAGTLFGLSMITKSQFYLLVPPTIFVVWVFGFGIFKILQWRHLIVVAILCAVFVSGWYVIQMMILGIPQFLVNAAVLREGARLHVLGFFSPIKIKIAIEVLIGSGYVVWGGLSLAYALWRIIRTPRNIESLRRLSLLVFVGVWLTWYIFASIGWARYAFIAIAVSHIFFAAMLRDVFKVVIKTFRAKNRLPLIQTGLLSLLLLITVWILFTGTGTLIKNLSSQDNSYYRFAHHLNQEVPPTAVVESWEWELDLVTNLNYHHPPTHITNLATKNLWLPDKKEFTNYSLSNVNPDYIIIGPFARWTGLYTNSDQLKEANLLISIGQYELYKTHK